ncbi:MAG: helix-turn-helix transcriptional regulator [Herminiimonas sp.]|uniref:helix-turn-helix domain-containing protein n=1 Tax=Herminiimonas sp. TaxID=1926289 RepID=UPI00272589FF|nr:helix-turn-helix transcriptional regulator [Herminiimonas sp.]MDO9422131.1 helix-turn-helix transcriptional regulator [Herminiimonas sp.]
MTVQISTLQSVGIPLGFGIRLKEERKRLGLNQAEFAQIGGVGRLAQLQYESEATAPTTRYLSAIGAIGVDLVYLVANIRLEADGLRAAQRESVERRAFEWVETYAETLANGKMSAEARRFIYQIIRGVLIQMELGALPEDFDIGLLMSQKIGNFQ